MSPHKRNDSQNLKLDFSNHQLDSLSGEAETL
jgi:hypothetical protein